MKEIYAAQAGENADAAVAEDANRAVGDAICAKDR
jgi:hypothetical protein